MITQADPTVGASHAGELQGAAYAEGWALDSERLADEMACTQPSRSRAMVS